MATERENQERIAGHDHARLLQLWEAILAGATPGWDRGKAFEYLILRAFELEGASVVWPFSVRETTEEELEQIDGAVFMQGFHCLVEAKDYDVAVNIKPLAKMRNQLLRRPAATVGLVFSRNGFTPPAETLARYFAPQTILLWQGAEIDLVLRKQKLVEGFVRKYRYAVTHGWPDLNLTAMEW